MSPSPSWLITFNYREVKLSIALVDHQDGDLDDHYPGDRHQDHHPVIDQSNCKLTWSITFTMSFSSSSVGDHPNVRIT